jgi:hypothetical protein
MTEGIGDLTYSAGHARSTEEMIGVVQRLLDWPTLEAVPLLAALDRRATGWLVTLTGWLAVTLTALAVSTCLFLFWLVVWAVGIQASVRLFDQLHPGLGTWGTVAAIVLASLILSRDKRLLELVAERLLLDAAGLPLPLHWGLKVARVLFYVLALLAVIAFLAVVCLPLAASATDWALWLIHDAGALLPYFTTQWYIGLSTTVVITLAVLGLRVIRRRALPLAVGSLVGVWGLLRLVQAANQLWPVPVWYIVGTILGAGLLYRTPLLFGVARAMTLPLLWLSRNTHRLVQRLRLRKLLWATIRHHRRRNGSRTGKRWRLALCSQCLARLERRQERLAYRRRLRFASCRQCHLDQHCYQNVRQTEGWLNQGMAGQTEQVGETVRVDLLSYLADGNKPLPLDLDSVVVANATDHQVEAFITLYQERGRQQAIRPLRTLRYRLEPEATAGPNVTAMLEGTFAKQEKS